MKIPSADPKSASWPDEMPAPHASIGHITHLPIVTSRAIGAHRI